MKHEKISIKWKIFSYLLVFTGILLVVLWLIQICYLDTLYKIVKTTEAERVTSEAIAILQEGTFDTDDKIDELGAKNNMAIFVSDTQGNALYSAEYISTSRLSTMPAELIKQYYEQAAENGGFAKIEFRGGTNKEFLENNRAKIADIEEGTDEDTEAGRSSPSAVWNDMGYDNMPKDNMPANGMWNDGTNPPPANAFEGFMQNHGQDWIESVIYVNIITIADEERVLMVNTQLTPVDATVNTLRIELMWITAIMIILSLTIALLISRQVSKSLISINEAAKEMARGNLCVRFGGKDYKEVAELSDTLNITAAELDKNERLRRELIANVSHDLRTPLTMIIAYAEVMRDLPGENTPENVQVVIDEADRLTNLVNDMLDISKLQAGVMEKNAAVYNLTGSIQSVFERYNKLKEQDGYTISFSYDQKVMVEADEYKIFQVIYNLMNNAINYTGTDKTIWVRQKIRGNHVRIEVADSGEGIQQESLPYVWDRYYKVDKTHKRAVMGTGLGLSIVKNILELHQAAYGVESTPGAGSTFWFELKISDTEQQ